MTGLLRLLRRPAARAVVGQGTQAVAGLVLQIAALRALDGAELAAFVLGYGLLVLVTALTAGLVGDSLTVLDRFAAPIRAGLHVWTLLACAVAAAVAASAAGAAGLPLWTCLLVGPACAAFVAEDVLRRLLMATGRFRALPAVDATSLVLALGTLAVASLGTLTLGSFVLALLVGQTGAAAVAWWCLPSGERPRGPWRRPGLGAVAAFGGWRAAAQGVRPATLTGLRAVVVVVAGAAAVEPLEAARVLTAPTLVLVAGIGSFLLPHFVSLRDRDLRHSLRVADRAAAGLAGGLLLVGLALLALLPLVAPLLGAGAGAVPATAVAAWTGYAVAAGALLPYASLASVHGRQRRVLAWRLVEFLPLAAVLPVVALGDDGVSWVPLVLALGPVLCAVAVRQLVLRPLVASRANRTTIEALSAGAAGDPAAAGRLAAPRPDEADLAGAGAGGGVGR